MLTNRMKAVGSCIVFVSQSSSDWHFPLLLLTAPSSYLYSKVSGWWGSLRGRRLTQVGLITNNKSLVVVRVTCYKNLTSIGRRLLMVTWNRSVPKIACSRNHHTIAICTMRVHQFAIASRLPQWVCRGLVCSWYSKTVVGFGQFFFKVSYSLTKLHKSCCVYIGAGKLFDSSF